MNGRPPASAFKIGPSNWYDKVFDDQGNWIAINEWHVNSKGRLCGGFVAFNIKSEIFSNSSPKWNVLSYDPLTISPSLLCKACGNHGYIRNNTWIKA